LVKERLLPRVPVLAPGQLLEELRLEVAAFLD
jgi:hypothetical protein